MTSKESLKVADNFIGFFLFAVTTAGIFGLDALDGEISTAGITIGSVSGIVAALFLGRAVNAFSLMQHAHRERLNAIKQIVQ